MDNQNNFNRFKVYTASAGSGKTFRLTIEYLKIALKKPETNFNRILAMTFTVKATNEMKARIVEACSAISQKNNQNLTGRNLAIFEELIKECPYSENQLIDRCQRLQKKLLHNYGEFAICTIDSFSQRLIRSFAYELDLPINFEVLLDESIIVDHLTNLMLSNVGGDNKDLNQLMLQLFNDLLNEKDSINIRNELEESVKLMLQEDSINVLQQLANLSIKDLLSIQQAINARYYTLKNKLQEMAQHITSYIHNNNIEVVDLFGSSRSQILSHPKKINNQKYNDITKTVYEIINGEKEIFKKNVAGQYQEASRYLRDKLDELITVQKQFIDTALVKNNFSQIALLYQFREYLIQYQQQEEVLLISEFNTIINQNIKGQPAPFLYEKLGDKYQNILIDEFQDTSVNQWHNLLPLVTESLSASPENSTLIVGDSKQAIYRFRGGEIKQLDDLPKIMGSEQDAILAEQEEVLRTYFEEHNLEYNFRSKENIVKFNNALYNAIASDTSLKSVNTSYEKATQQSFDNSGQGYVNIVAYSKWSKEEKTEHKNNNSNPILWDLYDGIVAAQKRGYPLNKMAIICRKNKELQEISSFLLDQDIAIQSKQSLLLDANKAVSIFPKLLELFIKPNDAILQADICNYLHSINCINGNKNELFQIIGRGHFTTIEQLQMALHQLGTSFDLTLLNIGDIYHSFELYCQQLPKEERQQEAINFFKDALWSCLSQNGNNRDEVVNWWKDVKQNLFIQSNEEAEGIHLLTIHKSKGLEFEIVFMPFTDWRFRSNKSERQWIETEAYLTPDLKYTNIPLSRQLEHSSFFPEYENNKLKVYMDNLNLLYVATTRAVSELYIGYQEVTSDIKDKTAIDNSGINYIIQDFLQSKGVTELTIGEPTTYREESKPRSLLPLTIYDYDQMVHPVVANRASAIWNDAVRDKIDYGQIIHTLFEQLNGKNTLDYVLSQAINSGLIEQADAPNIEQQMMQIINHPDLSQFFDAQANVLREQSILDSEGHEYIPDRIVISEDTARLLDFKTGSPQEKHKSQLNQYAQLLNEMGYSVISSQLVYLEPFEIISL